MNTSMYDLTINPLADGGMELQQGAGPDEPAIIHLHPVQIRLLAERAGLLAAPDRKALREQPGESTACWRLTEQQRAWLLRLASSVDEIRQFHIDSILDRCADGVEIALRLRAIEDALDDLMSSLGFERIPGEDPGVQKTPPSPAENSVTEPTISVTKPGPKPSGKALSDAERQRKHRARQAELLEHKVST